MITSSSSQTPSMGSLAEQRTLWREQSSSIPALVGGKAVWLPLVFELVSQVGEGRASDLDEVPELALDLDSVAPRQGGAAPKTSLVTWRQYAGFLRGLRLVERQPGRLHLSTTGAALRSAPTPEHLAAIMADRVRLFAEALSMLAEAPLTVDQVDELIQEKYRPSWQNNSKTRSRMDWLEVLGMIEAVGNRRWEVTPAGLLLLDGRTIVSPEALVQETARTVDISAPPAEVAALLDALSTSNRAHDSRSTYNIWVPAPPSNPNKVDNLRTIANAALMPIERRELFSFICETFSLRHSSVESMLPFMRASGVLVEVGRGVFEATPAAKAWVESGDDLNFIRIIHANMRFVGEMIRAVEDDVTRQAMYSQARIFGLNTNKARWIASFLLDTDLLEEPRYGSLRATPRGLALVAELPLAEVPADHDRVSGQPRGGQQVGVTPTLGVTEELTRLSREPLAGNKGSGRAFEDVVCKAFQAMGFTARVIGGSGETDVVVQWADIDGARSTAIVEVKARSSGQVAHTDVSELAIENHQTRHQAEYAAVIGPDFSGPTIIDMAKKKGWALVDAERLGALVDTSMTLGLRPFETGLMFKVPDGLPELEDLIETRRRELSIVSFLLAVLVEEESESGEAIYARDIYRDGRKTDLSPSIDEIVATIDTLERLPVGVLRMIEASDDPKNVAYRIGDPLAAARRLRAFADAIEFQVGEIPS